MELLVENIRKHYGRKSVLNGAGFSAEGGSCVGILGANGTGKSTLLRILAGVLRADGGSARWQGENLLKNASLRQRAVAYVPQGTPLIEELRTCASGMSRKHWKSPWRRGCCAVLEWGSF